ncbi:MAG: HAMP domain-containing histidine kinase [Clostridia bacterium]|nr:HAMP domain-containing histidine kinase [Clostridia bacterium]
MKRKVFKGLHQKLQAKAWFNLSLVLSIWAFVLLLSVAFFGVAILVVGYQLGYVKEPLPGFALIMMMVACVLIGTVEAAVIYRRLTRSIANVNKAMNEVANGNMSVRLDEDYCTEELRGMTVSFNKMVHQLSSNEILRNDFVANVSHEFKTPLATIEGYVTLLQDDSLTQEEKAEYISRITQTTRRLSDMTGNILLLSRLDNQNITPECQVYDLDEQIRHTLLELEEKWSEKELELDIDLEEVSCNAPKDLLHHVWYNLISNAIKFTQKGGKITICLAGKNGLVTVVIKDTGVGMSGDVLEHIFEKFYQGDPSHKGEGNGLGLPLARRIVKVCGGSIEAESRENEGSEFVVTIPQDCTKKK